MSTTTIRVDTDTHATLVEMSKAAGVSLIETVSEAAEALRRQRFDFGALHGRTRGAPACGHPWPT